ncbi:dTDP-glucose 4,6-dehydratase [Dongia soli]|uniref:dTDP-glucose 4,6-dehydratase n=1 Tax=Dongia soli TaxID=600628 RepID=A0ABU5EF28_9PROT|nr:dTDP-glucose 4,6-dehydratase [Dongia soli]MDY0884073.1 dTDP-glucose 4,6-dehydratase [Dongia soli]
MTADTHHERILVTGGCGFIGSALVRRLVGRDGRRVANIDKLTYAGDIANVAAIASDPHYVFHQVDINDLGAVTSVFEKFRPDGVVHLAAESHVDRSIDSPETFVWTNVLGTFNMLHAAHAYWRNLPAGEAERFRFLHVSTDEVYGSLGTTGLFSEETPYRPNSPYSASKAASDHLARAWHSTYQLPVIVTNCSNNYGPYQFPEKLIPTMIIAGLEGKDLPVYGAGENVRDWLFVEDHADALCCVLSRGRPGETYNIGGRAERRNIDLVRDICSLLDTSLCESLHLPHEKLIRFVADRPGHDLRYAIDDSKIRNQLGWSPSKTLSSGLKQTVAWYLENRSWWMRHREQRYDGGRLGLSVFAQDRKDRRHAG